MAVNPETNDPQRDPERARDATVRPGRPDAQPGGNRDQQTQQSGAMGQPGQGAGSNSTTSVGSSGNHGAEGRQAQRDAGGANKDKEADGPASQSGRGGV